MSNLIPLHDRVIVRKVDISLKTASGLLLSAGEVEDQRDAVWGRVTAVGSGKVLDNTGPLAMSVVVGDLVAFNERIPLRLHYRGEYIYILRESDILMINNDTDIIEGAFTSIDPIVKPAKMIH